ncbi:sensor histidine kinase [Selenomonas montiformis]|uniref:sensor histidine kinase n=1 Tax=Selenomonas montiformis TaxID=2652285 RepID=UPI003F88E796
MSCFHMNVRRRLLFNNFVMVMVPLLLLVLLCSIVFYGLRATGSFRDREMELFWPEAGSSASIHLALSHLRAHVDWKWRERSDAGELRRHCASLEKLGIRTAVIDDGQVVYETVPGTARQLLQRSYELAPQEGNAFLWDETGLVYRYLSASQHSEAVAIGSVPFQVGSSYFPDSIEQILQQFAVAAALLAGLIIIVTGVLLAGYLSRRILVPLEELRRSARRIEAGDYETQVTVFDQDELGETAVVFEGMRRQLQQNRRLHRVYERNRQELLAGIAHDLATPLTKIQGYTSGILDGIANTPEKRRHYLELVYRTSRSMERLVQDLFLFSKLELGKETFQWEAADLTRVLQDFVESQHEVLAAQGFHLCFDRSEVRGNGALVRMDVLQFQRVLENLLSNSIKYKAGEEGYLGISLSVDGSYFRLDFDDRGRGVDPKDLPYLFDSFYRTDKARSNVAKGSGLGLAVTKKILEEMGGKIWAEPGKTGKGLCICIELPQYSGWTKK